MNEAGNKQRILDVATRLFSTQGLKNTNIRQIAAEAKANSALIFYYFGCKEKLFFDCLAELASERFKVSEEILVAPQDLRDLQIKLGLFIQNMQSVFTTKKDLIKILHKELDNGNVKAIKAFEEHMLPLNRILENFFSAAQKKKLLRKDWSAKDITCDFFALLSNPLRNEIMLKSIYKEEIHKAGIETIAKNAHSRLLGLFLRGVLVHESQ